MISIDRTTAEYIRFWAAIAVTLGLCWAWIGAMALDMYGSMTGASAWMMRAHWDAFHLFLLWAMWAVMMAAMMLPSAIPLLLLFNRRDRRNGRTQVQTVLLASGYLAGWCVFSLLATTLQWSLGTHGWLNRMMEPVSVQLAGILLVVAGIYQFTPLKHACLRTCRSPLSFIMSRWRPGATGALRMGWEHGLYCLGCCWALMLLLFAGGVMNPWVIGALTAWVLIEKLTPFGEQAARVSGALLLCGGAWLLLNQAAAASALLQSNS